MLDEAKTKKQLIDEIKELRKNLSFLQHRQSDDQKFDRPSQRTLARKDFLLGLYERSYAFSDEALHRYILDEVVRLTGSEIGFLHLVSEDQQSVVLNAWNDEALKHCTASYETHYLVSEAGNWVDCIHSKRPVVYNDFSQAPNRKGLPPGHNPIRRFMSVPVIEQGKVRVIFGMGNKPDDYDDEDVFQTQLIANSLQSILTRRYAEKQLRENEERLSLTLQATQDGVWDWDLTNSTGYASPNYYAMLGIPPGEIPLNSEDWWRLIHPDDVTKVRQAMDRVIQMSSEDQGNVPAVEFRMQKKTGEWCWIMARGKVVTWDAEKRPLRMVGTHTDISDRKQVEEALRESEERYRTLFETANDAILLMDRDLIYVECNSKALEITGRNRDEIVGLNAHEYALPVQPDGRESQAVALEHIQEALAGQPQKFYWQDLRKDGAPLDIEVSLNKLILKGGDFLQVIARDITEPKQAEKALRESEGKFRDLVEKSIAGVYLVQDGRFKYVNAKCAEIFGYGIDEITDKMGAKDIIYKDDLPLVEENLRKRISGELKELHYGFRICTKNREIKCVEIYSSRTTYDGKPAVIGTLLDISEKIRVEESLRESEEIFRLLFEKSGDGNLIMENGRFIDCNEAALKILGCTDKSKILNLSPADVSPKKQPDGSLSKERVKAEIALAFQQGTNRFDWLHQGFDGALRYLDVILTPISLKGKKLLYVTWRDITQRKKTEEDLLFMNALHFAMQNVSLDGVLVVDDEGRMLSSNARFSEIWGIPDHILATRSNDQALAFALSKLVNPDDYFQRVMELYLHRDEKSRQEVYLCDGRVLDQYSAPVIEASGKYHGRIWFFRDITERKRIEEALRRNEATLRSVFNATPVGLCIMNGRVFQSANKAWYDLFGYTEDDIIGQTTRMLYENEAEYERIGCELYTNRTDRDLSSVQTRIKRKDGVLRDVIVIATPLEREYPSNGTVVTIEDITDRKRADEELQYRNTLLSTQLEASMDGILVVDEAGQMTSFNQRFVAMWGIPDEVVVLRSDARALQSVRDLLEDPDDYIEKVNYLHAHHDETNRNEILLKDGRTIDRYTAPVVGADSRYYGRIWQFRDITDYKRAQENIRKSEAAYREIFNAVTEAIFIHDLYTGEILDVNNSMLEMFGYVREDVWRLSVGEFSSGQIPYTQEKADELIAKAAGGQPQVFEWCGRRKNGQLFPAEVSLKRDVIAGQECVLAVVRDITERKRAEEALRASERRLNDVIEFLPDAILVIDRYGKVQAWNRAMETMTRVKKEDMLGKGDYEYALPFYGMRRPILIDLALCQDKETEKQYTTIQRGGDVLFGEAHTPNLPPGNIHLSATASVLRDSNGEVIAAIECIRDITERGRLETQLRQAQKMEAIGTLAGGIAHDFNNILASTIGYTELAMMNIGKPNLQTGYMEQVMKACDRAKNLVNQILAFSRQREQEKKPLDMTVIVKEALKLLRASLPSTVKINHHFPSEPTTVMADPTQIHQIIMNLCTNAAQAMRENGGELDVNLFHLFVPNTVAEFNPVFKTGPYVHLEVKDTGHGIDPAIIDKIFDPFFTTKRQQEGTGLGLSVVYGIVNSYDGVIQVKSEPGQGTTFNVYIPATGDMEVPEVRRVVDPIPGGCESILLVDDEELLVQAMQSYLQSLGYDVISTTNSPEALYMVRENPQRVDLIVTDMTMPHMTGLKLSREILAINPLVPIILCTGYNESVTEEEVKRNGIREFVLKPVPLQKIARLIRQVLDGI